MLKLRKEILVSLLFVIFAFSLGIKLCSAAQEVLINDILADPQKFINATITIKGSVMNVNADPAGTTRGTYKVTDDSEMEIFVKTKNLPPIGKTFTIVGVVAQDPTTSDIFIKELSRTSSSSMFIYIAIGAGALLVLVIILLVLVLRPAKKTQTTPVVQPSITVGQPAAKTSDKTVIVQHGKSAASDATIVALSVRAELSVITGKDSGKRFMLIKPVMTIGRTGGRNNDIELSESSVSREQAKITFDHSSKIFTLINESATNPSKVNGEQVNSKTLAENDEIEFGFCKLKFRVLH